MKWLKELLVKPLSNQRGSTLTMTIIVIAVLSFSVTTITRSTINQAGTTTLEVRNSGNESEAKGLITQAINELEVFINSGGNFDAFNTTEISRLFSEYGVTVSDDTALYPDFGLINGSESRVYRFAIPLDSGLDLVKYVYLSTSGTTVGTPHPFQFTLGTNGDLILNGGYYDEVEMFGKNVYFSNMAPWYENDTTNTHYATDPLSGTFPDIETPGQSTIYYTANYQFCDNGCFTVDPTGTNEYVIDKTQYENVVGSTLPEQGITGPDSITDFFSNFNFDEFFIDMISNDLPTDNRTTSTITMSTYFAYLRDQMGQVTYKNNGRPKNYPNTPYADITGDAYFDFTQDISINLSVVNDTSLTIYKDISFNDFDDEALIVLGDLTFDNQGGSIQDIKGTFVVTGNLIFTGNSKNMNRATFIVLGETIFDMNDGETITTSSDQFDFTLISKDNIRINSINEANSNNPVETLTAFFYSNESVWIDAINSKIRIKGSIYAKAVGNSSNPIFLKDENGTQVNGIVVNSFKGYVNDTGGTITYIPSSTNTNNRFYIEEAIGSRYNQGFLNFPDFDNTTVIDGDVTIDTSEWIKE